MPLTETVGRRVLTLCHNLVDDLDRRYTLGEIVEQMLGSLPGSIEDAFIEYVATALGWPGEETWPSPMGYLQAFHQQMGSPHMAVVTSLRESLQRDWDVLAGRPGSEGSRS